MTTLNSRTSQGSVMIPLQGATFIDFEPESSTEFYLLVAYGQNLETFNSNNLILVIKGDAVLDKVDVTKWLPKPVKYTEFNIPAGWSDGSEYI